jgi:thiamine biosynthesis lipoprotein
LLPFRRDRVADGPDGAGWQIGVEDPLNPGELNAALQVRGTTAVCTSSIARLRWRHGEEEVHHLIDPRSRRPGGEGLLAVTVVGRDPAWAEVWSKALFLHGLGGIAQAAKGHKALWISRDGALHVTDEALGDVFWQR